MRGVALDGVTKRFGERDVIRPTTLRVGADERIALIGPSGCGKSTLIRMMVGLIEPDAGTVRLDDAPVTPETARKRIGYVIQDGGLFPHLSAEDNVTLVARLDGWDEPKRRSRVDELAELAKLPKPLLRRFPRELSGGERQRVGIMRALMLNPDVLLLDEPLGALDPIVRARLQQDLRAAFESLGKCVVLVTHDMAEAAYLARDIVVLHEGEIVQRGTMKELVESPKHPFVKELLSAQRTLAEAIA
jgi:osmoprotectant transport system ATP-binding protein